MQDLTLETLVAVFEEIFGTGLFWTMVVVIAAATSLLGYLVWRDRGLDSHALIRAELAAPIGAVFAILFVQFVTSSTFGDIGGPVDLIVLLAIAIAIAIAGAGAATIVVYELQALLSGRRKSARRMR